MRFTIQVVIEDDARHETIEEIITLEKSADGLDQIGLSLAESKALLKNLQRHIVEAQTAEYLERHRACPHCGDRRSTKDHHTIVFRTLFGNLPLKSPRLYHCPCREQARKTFSPLTALMSEHVAPELLYLETKWASLASYGLTVKLLQEVLPVDEHLNAATVRNHLLRVAERGERELGDEAFVFIDGCPHDWAALPRPEGEITVGLDGGYLRDWHQKKQPYQAIIGKSIPEDRPAQFFGFVYRYDEKPKRRLFDLLQGQGMQPNQQVTFLSDGAADLWELQQYLHPYSEHHLDWFHLTMRLTVLKQYARGVRRIDEDIGTTILKGLESTKWYLWHGNVYEAGLELDEIEMLTLEVEERYHRAEALMTAVVSLRHYIRRCRGLIPNYGERWRHGERIATSFVESSVNVVLSKRFCKKQQMQWTPRGAHLLLQTRTAVLNENLEARFRRWYPMFRKTEESMLKQAA